MNAPSILLVTLSVVTSATALTPNFDATSSTISDSTSDKAGHIPADSFMGLSRAQTGTPPPQYVIPDLRRLMSLSADGSGKAWFQRKTPPSAATQSLSCEQCDEMFQECISEVDPEAPAGYEACQILWDRCKSHCSR
jgi:hypothetical protein